MAFSGIEQPQVHVQGDVVFVGHGIVAPEQKWNDYAGVDVKGKWVLVMVNDPPAPADEPTLFGGKALTYYGRWTYKFEEAARQGAAGAHPDSHRRIGDLSVAGRAVVVDRHAVFAAAGRRARRRSASRRGSRTTRRWISSSAAARISMQLRAAAVEARIQGRAAEA